MQNVRVKTALSFMLVMAMLIDAPLNAGITLTTPAPGAGTYTTGTAIHYDGKVTGYTTAIQVVLQMANDIERPGIWVIENERTVNVSNGGFSDDLPTPTSGPWRSDTLQNGSTFIYNRQHRARVYVVFNATDAAANNGVLIHN